MGLMRITAATSTCVDLASAKAQCKVDVNDDDALITSMIASASEEAETIMRRAILPQSWRLTLDDWFAQQRTPLNPSVLELAFGLAPAFRPVPLQASNIIELRPVIVSSVDAVKYVDTNGTQQTLASTEYQVSLNSHLCARIAPAFGKSWPTVRSQMDAVQIDFTAGWADASQVPANIKRWVLMRVGAYYDNREAWTLGKAIERNSFVDRLLDRWRVPTI